MEKQNNLLFWQVKDASRIQSIEKILSLTAVVLTAVFLRLIPHPPNFAPIGGLALFSGAYLSGRKSLILPLLAMMISDYFLGFHNTMIFVYISFILIVVIGKYLQKNKQAKFLLSASLLSSVLFFIITNFGSWFVMPVYSKNISGLVSAYYMGIPFFRNTLFSDLIYTFSFFFGYRLIIKIIPLVIPDSIRNLYKLN